MSKFQIKQKKKSDFFLCLSLILGLIFLGNFTYAKGYWASLKAIESKLDSIIQKAKDQQQNQYFASPKISTDLFHKNLKKNDEKVENSLAIALKITQEKISTDHKCDLDQQQIASYIYLNDPEFKQYRDLQDLKNLKGKKDEKPEPIDRVPIRANGCLKLGKCIEPNHLNAISITRCNQIVMDAFNPAKREAEDRQRLQLTNFAANKYQNGDKKDSDYDLLSDINQIGKIFFNGSQGFKDAPQTIFYQSPDLSTSPESNANAPTPPRPNIANNNQQNSTPQTPSTQNQASNSKNLPLNSSENFNPQNLSKANTTNEPSTTEDSEINSQLASSTPNLAKNQQDETLFANQCLPPGASSIQKTEKKPELDAVISSVFDQQFNSPATTQAQQQYQQAQTALNQINKLVLAPTRQNAPWSNPDSLTPQGQKELKKTLESCTKKCEAKDKKGDYQLAYDERQICKLQCLCGERNSPALEKNADFPILEENALRIRFCTVPAKSITVNTNAKTIYSIAEIVTELLDPISELNNGGKLSTRHKKKEFLDSEFSPKKMDKTAALIVWVNSKTDTPITSDTDKKVENQAILDAITLPADKNSYLIINPPTTTQKPSVKGEKTVNNDKPSLPTDPTTVLTRNNQSDLFIHLSEFLTLQQQFLSSFQTSLNNINSTLTALENKKK